jgi:GNAT superfamily N-acetyltransferase
VSDALICREAVRVDLPQVLRLYAQPDLDDGQVLAPAQAEAIFDRIARYPDYRIYVAQLGPAIVGTFALLIMDNLGHLGARSGVVEDVAVDPRHQRLGVGRFMMEHALKCCRDKGCYKLALSSNLKRDRAHAFYELLGFERHGYSFRMDLETGAPLRASGPGTGKAG